MQTAHVSADVIERRVAERVPVAVFGRCMLPNRLEVPCQTIDISSSGVGVAAVHTPEIGEHVIIYLDHVGRIEGEVVRVHESGFALSIIGTERKHEKLAAEIDKLKERLAHEAEHGPRARRIRPSNPNSEIKLADGRVFAMKIVDISLSGAAVKVDVQPAIGSELSLAGMQGKVVRHIPFGIALEFVKPATSAALDKRFN